MLKNIINSIINNSLQKFKVFGALDIHGAPRNVLWTTLSTTANFGSNSISLNRNYCINC